MSCHCLCAINHPSQGICTGEGTETMVFSKFSNDSPFSKIKFDRVEVTICTPCKTATMARRASGERPRPETPSPIKSQ